MAFLFCQVFAGLSDVKLRDKICSLKESSLFKEFHVFRDSNGYNLPNVTYHSVPRALRKFPAYCLVHKTLTGLVHSLRHPKKDSLIISYNCMPHGLLACIIAIVTRRKLITCLIGTDINEYLRHPIYGLMIKAVCKRSRIVIVTGSRTRRIMESLGFKNVRIVGNTIDTERFSSRNIIHSTERGLLYVGNLTQNKRLDRLIDLVASVNNRGYNLACSIAGTGPETSKIRVLINNTRYPEKFSLLGHRHDIDSLLKNHLALCLFSETEGFPAVIAESLCSGVPVLTIEVGDISDIAKKPNPLLICHKSWGLDYFVSQLIQLSKHADQLEREKHAKSYRKRFAYSEGGKSWREALSDLIDCNQRGPVE